MLNINAFFHYCIKEYLFDDYLAITFNYKEGTKRVTFAEIEEAFGSDLSSFTAPYKKEGFMPSFLYRLVICFGQICHLAVGERMGSDPCHPRQKAEAESN